MSACHMEWNLSVPILPDRFSVLIPSSMFQPGHEGLRRTIPAGSGFDGEPVASATPGFQKTRRMLRPGSLIPSLSPWPGCSHPWASAGRSRRGSSSRRELNCLVGCKVSGIRRSPCALLEGCQDPDRAVWNPSSTKKWTYTFPGSCPFHNPQVTLLVLSLSRVAGLSGVIDVAPCAF